MLCLEKQLSWVWYSGPFNLTSFIKFHFCAVAHIPLPSIYFFLLGKNWLSLSSSVAFSSYIPHFIIFFLIKNQKKSEICLVL